MGYFDAKGKLCVNVGQKRSSYAGRLLRASKSRSVFLGFRGLGVRGLGFIGFRVDTEFCTYGFGQNNFRLAQGLEFVLGEKVAS